MGFSPEHVSLLDDIYGDDNRSVLDVALAKQIETNIGWFWP